MTTDPQETQAQRPELNTITTDKNNQHQHTKQSDNNPEHQPLKPAQRRAIEHLAAGGRVMDAAMAAGVHRNTVQRWLRDSAFVAELRSVDDELREAARTQMCALAERAGTCVEHAIARGDARLALQLLKTMHIFQFDSPTGRSLPPMPATPTLANITRVTSTDSSTDDTSTTPAGGHPVPSIEKPKSIIFPPREFPRRESPSNVSTVDETDDPNRYICPEVGNLAPPTKPSDEQPLQRCVVSPWCRTVLTYISTWVVVQLYATFRTIAGVFGPVRLRPTLYKRLILSLTQRTFASLLRTTSRRAKHDRRQVENRCLGNSTGKTTNLIPSAPHSWSDESSRRLAFLVRKTYDSLNRFVPTLPVIRIITAYTTATWLAQAHCRVRNINLTPTTA